MYKKKDRAIMALLTAMSSLSIMMMIKSVFALIL